MNSPMWTPSEESVERSHMTAFRREANIRYRLELSDYKQLFQWSINNPERFWGLMWDFGGVIAEKPASSVLDKSDHMINVNWFVGARLNFARNLLRFNDDSDAIIFTDETGFRRTITYSKLRKSVGRLQHALHSLGVRSGDRIAGYLPNLPETIIAMLATASIGAIWSSCSSEFGVQGALDRFSQIEPKVIFGADGYYYGGKKFDSRARIAQISANLTSVEKIVLIPYVEPDDQTALSEFMGKELAGKFTYWEDFVGTEETPELVFESLPFNHPLYIMFSSGTTGKPKSIVHGAGGTLIQHLKEHLLHTDLKRGDRFFYYTTCGWMMWNWLVSGLATGATLILYEGSPTYPNPGALFDLAEKENINILGTSARYISAVEKTGIKPIETNQLTELRMILSTGSPLLPDNFDYIYRDVKSDVCLSSISGGTDIISCFALGNPSSSVYRGELQTRGLGMDVQVLDDTGKSLNIGKGELSCLSPFPSAPVGFWNDEDNTKYKKAYYDRFPDIWSHGDWAEITKSDGIIIYGRSDATLNPGGVRIGAAEIYREVEWFEEIIESIVVSQLFDNQERIVLFVKLKDGLSITEELKTSIRKRLRKNATHHHVPEKIISVPDIPRTISGKIVEIAVRNVVNGNKVKNLSSLANPEALDYFRNLPDLKYS